MLRLQIERTPTNASLFDVTDETSVRYVDVSISADSVLTTGVSGTAQPKTLWLDTSQRTPASVQQVIMTPPNVESNYLIVTSNQLTQPALTYDNVAQAYADYRSSMEGGGFTVDLQTFENLRNVFSYGEYTPLAIRRYAAYMLQNGNPEFLLLAGKSMDLLDQYERRKGSVSFKFPESFPCWGYPCSDNLYTAGLRGAAFSNEPALATGRISTENPQWLAWYFEKVKEHEQLPTPQEWQKQMLHLSGGKTNNELTAFRSFVDSYQRIVEGEFLGASVSTASKRTTSELEFIDIVDQVNEGVSLVTFFGHSGITTTDITIGKTSNPTLNYNNRGKYPMLLINGCLTGNVYDDVVFTIGEDWITSPNKGAIAYLAHSDLGYSLDQHDFTTKFYRTHFQDSAYLNQPIGKVVKEVIRRSLADDPNNKQTWSHMQQYVLQGDPAVRLFSFNLPDYAITDASISAQTFFGEELSVLADSFRLAIDIRNLGIVDSRDFDIAVVRTFADGTTKRYSGRFYRPINNREVVYFTIRNSVQDQLLSPGINRFEVFIDSNNTIEEAKEDNNYGSIEILFPRGGMEIITPREFSILNQQPINIIAQNKNLLDEPRSYIFQLDTTDLFNSSVRKDTTIFSGLTPSWSTSLLTDNNTDSLVYYIRTRYAEIGAEEDTTWATTSFLYIKDGPEGWSQSHFPQYKKNRLSKIERDDARRQFDFIQEQAKLEVVSVGSGAPDRRAYSVRYDGVNLVENGVCGQDRMMLMKFNADTGVPYISDYYVFATSISCGRGTPGSATWLDAAIITRFNAFGQYFNDTSPGDFVLIWVSGSFDYARLGDRDWNQLARIGADVEALKATLRNGDPFIMFGRNGAAPGTAITVFPDLSEGAPPRSSQQLTAEFGIDIDNTLGTMTSTVIGPATAWGNIHFNFAPTDNPNETKDIQVSVVDFQGNEGIILEKLPNSGYDVSWINPQLYPYLKLTANLSDPIQQTPAQLRKWQVYYKEAPEGILFFQANAQDDRFGNADSLTLSLGARTQFPFKFQNVSTSSFEQPIIVEYQLRNLETNLTKVFYDTLTTLAIGDSLLFDAAVPTEGMEGENRLRIFVNPRLQAEQVYDNNIVELDFTVVPDLANPVLDVVFDGVHIMDGEIVSPTPMITVSLKDENKFLIRNDTTGIDLFLAKCDDCSIDDIPIGEAENQFERIHFSDARVTWTSAENNDFQIFFQPELEDGNYVFVAQGEDLSGNRSGVKPYRVRFEVINESTISNFYPYPNPFSDNVRFVFTLTGSEIPQEMKIQIMTVSGRVVREITQDEIGPIRAGHNMTEYAWDGKDEFGGQLANGVYLYRVIIPKEGDTFQHRETQGDNLFKNGFGKMYLLR